MATVELFEAVAAGGIRDTHFFNGRLLTAGDLRTSQDAVVARDQQLGRAIGAGVARGLEVTLVDPGLVNSGRRPVLRVTAGLALSRRGDTLELPEAVDVALVKEAEARRAAAGEFELCVPPRTSVQTNLGLYLLTVAPASRFEGLAPMTELHVEGVGSACGRRYEIDSVRFALERLDLAAEASGAGTLAAEVSQLTTELNTQLAQLLSAIPVAGLAGEVERKLSRLRNAVAHLCFGTEERRAFVADPLGGGSARAEYGALDRQYTREALADCEVPLALVYWSVRGVEFADMWAVRRPPLRASAGMGWTPHLPERLEADGLAMWLQFQDHLRDLGARPGVQLGTLRAVDYFRYLPPVGIAGIADRPGVTGIDQLRFCDGLKVRPPAFLNGARLHHVTHRALRFPAIDPADGEVSWLYLVRENVTLFNAGGGSRPQACLMFTSGHVPFAARARFDLAYWNYANYA